MKKWIWFAVLIGLAATVWLAASLIQQRPPANRSELTLADIPLLPDPPEKPPADSFVFGCSRESPTSIHVKFYRSKNSPGSVEPYVLSLIIIGRGGKNLYADYISFDASSDYQYLYFATTRGWRRAEDIPGPELSRLISILAITGEEMEFIKDCAANKNNSSA